jgi:ParB/RepB/Spo0J family partition protein
MDKPGKNRRRVERHHSRKGAPSSKPQRISLTGISVQPRRLRALQPDKADSLAESMAAQGLLQPIIVRRRAHGYLLVAGRHRLEAAKKLKWPTIDCIVKDGMDADAAELAEIDENLVRAELSSGEKRTSTGEKDVREGTGGTKISRHERHRAIRRRR